MADKVADSDQTSPGFWRTPWMSLQLPHFGLVRMDGTLNPLTRWRVLRKTSNPNTCTGKERLPALTCDPLMHHSAHLSINRRVPAAVRRLNLERGETFVTLPWLNKICRAAPLRWSLQMLWCRLADLVRVEPLIAVISFCSKWSGHICRRHSNAVLYVLRIFQNDFSLFQLFAHLGTWGWVFKWILSIQIGVVFSGVSWHLPACSCWKLQFVLWSWAGDNSSVASRRHALWQVTETTANLKSQFVSGSVRTWSDPVWQLDSPTTSMLGSTWIGPTGTRLKRKTTFKG